MKTAKPRMQKQPGRRWWVTAHLVRKMKRTERLPDTYDTYAEWLQALSHQSGKSTAQLRRYVTSLEFAERLVAERHFPDLKSAVSVSEVTLDALARLRRISPRLFKKNLRLAKRGELTYRVVLTDLAMASLRHPSRLGAREAARRLPAQYARSCEQALLANPKILSEDHDNCVSSPDLPFTVSVDVLLPAVDMAWCDGCKFVLLEAKITSAGDIGALVGKVAWSSRFFRRFWVWMTGAERLVEEFIVLVRAGGLNNVAVVKFTPAAGERPIVQWPAIGYELRNYDPQRAFLDALSSIPYRKLVARQAAGNQGAIADL